jgi:hypothetical protein
MTHPPAGPSQPPRPSGPRDLPPPLDPNSDAGRKAAEALSEALAQILPKVLARRNNASKRHGTDAA